MQCRRMNTLLGLVDKYCRDTRMSLSVTKTIVLSTRRAGRSWNIGQPGNTLEDSMMAKYLGVNIQLRGKCTVRREEDVISSEVIFTHSITSLTRANLDRSRVARILCESFGVPSILILLRLWSSAKRLWWPLRSFRPMLEFSSCRPQGRPPRYPYGPRLVWCRLSTGSCSGWQCTTGELWTGNRIKSWKSALRSYKNKEDFHIRPG